jgi:hypothetical protein
MDETPETSESLIARVKDLADGDAWSEFLTMYRPVGARWHCAGGCRVLMLKMLPRRFCWRCLWRLASGSLGRDSVCPLALIHYLVERS